MDIIIAVEYINPYTDGMPFDRNGYHASGRVIVVKNSTTDKITYWNEYEDDWTWEIDDDEELIGKVR